MELHFLSLRNHCVYKYACVRSRAPRPPWWQVKVGRLGEPLVRQSSRRKILVARLGKADADRYFPKRILERPPGRPRSTAEPTLREDDQRFR
jgi:hypothetical protein